MPAGRLLATYLGPQWRRLALLGVLLLATIALRLAGPQVLRAFVDTAAGGASTASLIQLALPRMG